MSVTAQMETKYVAIYVRDDARVETRNERPLPPGEVFVRVEYVGISGSELHLLKELEESLELPQVTRVQRRHRGRGSRRRVRPTG
jgi:threonine dehydrogenase-like Zn-dependent dehydrogenase